jgi:hypothetical protein
MRDDAVMARKDPTDVLELDDEVYRHIGRIVSISAHLEVDLTTYIVTLVSVANASKVRPLIEGRRLSDLIDSLSRVLPDYSDGAALIKALRRANDYRDQVTHSTRTLGVDENNSAVDVGSLDVQWRARQQRKQRILFRLEVDEARKEETKHALLQAVVESLVMHRLKNLSTPIETAPTIRDEISRHDPLLFNEQVLTGYDLWIAP